MKTKIIGAIVFVFHLSTYVGCSKDSNIHCGTITDISISYSQISTIISYHLTVELSDGSIRYDTIKSDSYEVGDEYCNATDTSR